MFSQESIVELFPTALSLGVWNYWIMLLITFLESLPFIGLIVPGTLLLILAGFLSTTQAFDLGDMIWFAALGGIFGDGFAYMLGRSRRLRTYFERFWPKEALAPSESFVELHGGKSVFFGRFIGPIRPFVPYLAGALKMKVRIFAFWNITSGFAWAGLYLLLGYAFGEAWQEAVRWSSRIGWVTIGGAGILVSFWAWRRWRRSKQNPLVPYQEPKE